MSVVVDTNVAVVANGRNTHASIDCELKCIEYLENLVATNNRTRIVLDDADLIISEYKKHLNHKGQPGVGDFFYKYLHNNMYLGKKIRLAAIHLDIDEARGFKELPPNSIDKSDRKFLAVAIVTNAKIVNAVETDWHEQIDFVTSLAVRVEQLCPEFGCKK
jgi:hypothetical protein